MQAMVLSAPRSWLESRQIECPLLKPTELRVRVLACGVCRTDLHVIDGDLTAAKFPLVLGHEIVGVVEEVGSQATGFEIGQRIGIPWLARTCLECDYCLHGLENLCTRAEFTGYTTNGGYAETTNCDARFCFPIPQTFSSVGAAPLLCAGLIGWRTLKLAGPGENIGIYGFGAAAHIVIQIAKFQGRSVYAFTSPGDTTRQDFARSLGATWAGGSDEACPARLDCALIFAPVGALIPKALRDVRTGGTVVCGGIHMSDIPSFPYEIIWGERALKTVANLTRADGHEFFDIATKAKVSTSTFQYRLDQANEAIADFRQGKLHGAAVLVPT